MRFECGFIIFLVYGLSCIFNIILDLQPAFTIVIQFLSRPSSGIDFTVRQAQLYEQLATAEVELNIKLKLCRKVCSGMTPTNLFF